MPKTILKLFFLIMLVISTVAISCLDGAPLRNVPVTITQPDGVVIHCFASGDEFYNWLHDENGYTFIQDATTGYYTYAIIISEKLVPSEHIVGRVDPASLGLAREANVYPRDIVRKFSRARVGSPLNPEFIVSAPHAGTLNNLVVFIRFSDDSEFTETTYIFDHLFNTTVAGANSLRNYYTEVSYNQLTISSSFYPNSTPWVTSYQDSNSRDYYRPFNLITNWNGYLNEADKAVREQMLLRNAVNAIASQVDQGLDIDGNSDGNVDNICFIIKGTPEGWSQLLWSHMASLNFFNVYINSKQVMTYDFLLEDDLISRGVGILAHETFHSLGAPDLYHYVNQGVLQPAFRWDLMDVPLNPPQHMTAYMKMRYGKWLAEIPTILTSGVVTLNPLTASSNNAREIVSPNSAAEHFVVEYRKRTGTFENSLPDEGLIVYRINTSLDGQGNANGPPDELYVYRPDGTGSANGNPSQANFNSSVGRTVFNDSTNPSSFLSDGNPGGLNVSNVSVAGDTISFSVSLTAEITTATTGVATDVTANSARFNGTVNPGGFATTAYFEWGTSTAYGNTTPSQSVGSGTSSVKVSWNQSGLSSGTTYHYRVVGNNTKGIVNGLDATFTPGTINQGTIWTPAGNPHVITNSVTINAGATLTIQPGVIVKLSGLAGYLRVYGNIIAQGTVDQPIVFTSLKDDTVGGDTNGDGSSSTPGAGDWVGVNVSPVSGDSSVASEFEYVTMRYGSTCLQVSNQAAGVTINHSVFDHCSTGVSLTSVTGGSVTASTFTSNSTGLQMQTSSVAVSDNSFMNNSIAGSSDPGSLGGFSNNTASGTGQKGVTVSGTLNSNATWKNGGMPYVIPAGQVSVNIGVTLTIEPGVIVKSIFNQLATPVRIYGKVIARGTVDQPIVFTSIQDDTAGGDTNGDGSSTPWFGDWVGVKVSPVSGDSSVASEFEYVTMRYGSTCLQVSNQTAGVTINHSVFDHCSAGVSLTSVTGGSVTASTFTSNSPGVTISSSSTLINFNNFTGNTTGMTNNTQSMVVDARYNYWGNSSGPNDPSDDRATGGDYNPTGTGNQVSNYVNYRPWSTTPVSDKAIMTSPTPGSIFTSSTVTFSWSAGAWATEYYLQVGTSLGGQELYSVSEGTNLSATVLAIPTDGSPVYARLWTNVAGLWSYNDYTYTSCTGCTVTKAVMTTPAPGSTLSSSMTTFWWSASLGSECYLQVGTTLGGQQIYSAGQGTNLSVQVPALPTNGSPVYARLWTNIGGAWLYNDYNYTACSGCTATKAVMTSPATGSTLNSSSVTFTWSGSLASQYYLQVGTVPGGQQIYSVGQGTNLSTQVTGLSIGGGNVYVRLWSEVGGAWWYNDYSYVACSGCTPTLAAMTTPAQGATLSSTLVTFTWGTSLASECYLQVGTTVGGQEIYSAGEGTNLSSEVMDLPNNAGAVYVRLWSRIGGAWLFNDYSYTACTGCTATKAAMVTPAPGSTLSSRAVTFTWSASLAAEYYLFVGTTVGGQEIYSAGQGTNLSVGVSGLPNNGSTVHARLWSRIGGAWLFNDYTYTTCTGCQ